MQRVAGSLNQNCIAGRAAVNGTPLPRVAIVGTGFVGSTTAYALLVSGVAAEIVLIGRNRERSEGHVQDLRDAEVFSHRTRVSTGDFNDCCSADIIIICVGLSQSAGRSREDGMEVTAALLKDLVRDVSGHNPRAILLIASNPVDVMTHVACKWSGLPPDQVIGSGTTLDTARFRQRLADKCEVSPENVHAYIIGEHGESQIPVLSSARIAGMPLEEFCRQRGIACDGGTLAEIVDETRMAGATIIKAKGATYYGIGAALARIVRAIVRDERTILTVSSRAPESQQLGEVSLSLPTIIARGGVRDVLSIPLNSREKRALQESAVSLRRHVDSLTL
jgi:L-lactate dehydrogenase